MDPVGSEPARDRSAAESHASGSNTEGRSDSARSSALVQFRAMAGNLSRHMWRQATDLTSQDWPPKWLIALAALWILWLVALILWLVIAIIIPTFIKILVALGLGTSILISETKWAQVVLGPIHSYLDTHSGSLPFSLEQLFAFWVLFGVIVFFSSFRGSIGGRIGWAVFGIATGAVVWSETPEPSKWLATGLTTFLWSLLSTLAYRKLNATSSSTVANRKRRFPEFLSIIERRAEQNARVLNYPDLAHYLDNKANQSPDIIATDLGIPPERVSALLSRRFPQGLPPGGLSFKDRREILNKVLSGEESQAEMARRYNTSASTISRLVKDYKSREAK